MIYKPPNNQLLMTATSFSFMGALTCPSFLLQYMFDRFYGDNMELVEQVSEFQLGVMGTAAVASMFTLYLCRSIPFRIYNHEKEYDPNAMELELNKKQKKKSAHFINKYFHFQIHCHSAKFNTFYYSKISLPERWHQRKKVIGMGPKTIGKINWTRFRNRFIL